MSEAIHFRSATAADRLHLIPLINSAFSIESFIDGTRTNEEQLASMMEKGTVFVAEDNSGRLLGSVYTELRGSRGYLGMLAVDPAHQGSGLGRRLLSAAEDRFCAQGCEAIDITVLSLRTELPPIYRRFGFVETGIESFHPHAPLKDGADCHCIVMSKKL